MIISNTDQVVWHMGCGKRVAGVARMMRRTAHARVFFSFKISKRAYVCVTSNGFASV